MKFKKVTRINNFLAISKTCITTVLDKLAAGEGFIDIDRRGHHQNRPRTISKVAIENAMQHIKLFPTVESHYCRQDTKVLYLSEDLNLSIMYRLYLEWMKKKNNPNSVKKSYYRFIFNNKFNYSFNKRKKDVCDVCLTFRNLPADEKLKRKDEHSLHVQKKETPRKLLKEETSKFKKNSGTVVAIFDLEKALNIPQSESSCLYYKRKISVYNFTIHVTNNDQGICNVWPEVVARRGSSEMGSCLFKFINDQVGKGVKEFIFYSDNCTGQNKNQNLFSMYVKVCSELEITITHR